MMYNLVLFTFIYKYYIIRIISNYKYAFELGHNINIL